MPRIRLTINERTYTIDSSNRDTIKEWLGEIVGRMPGYESDYAQFQLYPLPLPDAPDRPGGLDWPAVQPNHNSYDLSPKGVKLFAKDMLEALGEGAHLAE